MALDVELHSTLGKVRGPGDTWHASHSFLLRHHRYPQMYVHPLVCSSSSSYHTCTSNSFSSVPESTMLVFRHMGSGFVDLSKIGFELVYNPYETAYAGMPSDASGLALSGMVRYRRSNPVPEQCYS